MKQQFSGVIIALCIGITSMVYAKAPTPSVTEQVETSNGSATESQPPSNVNAAAVHFTCQNYFEHEFNSARRENVGRKANCVAFFFGVGSTLLLLQADDIDTAMCLPENLSTEELIRQFNAWMDSHQDQRQMIATEVVFKMLRENYACEGIVPLPSAEPRGPDELGFRPVPGFQGSGAL